MSDLRELQAVLCGSGAVHAQLAARSAEACQRWAHTLFDGAYEVLVWVRERGDYPHGVAYRVSAQVLQRGVWRVLLCPPDALPAGVGPATREAVAQALATPDAAAVPDAAVDQLVQCGLFGEVLYR